MNKKFLLLFCMVVFALSSAFATITTFPYTVDFETGATPAEWTTAGEVAWAYQNGGATGFGDTGHPAAAHGGSFNAILVDESTTPNLGELISPVLDLSAYQGATLQFWLAMEGWAGDQDELKVYYKADENADWAQVAHFTESLADWAEKMVILPTASATAQIKFEGNAKYGYGVCIDDITITGLTGSPLGTIAGTVTAGGNPANEAMMVLKNAAGEEVETFTTAADGMYSFDELAPGDYMIRVALMDYNVYMSDVINVPVSGNISHDITLVAYDGDYMAPSGVTATATSATSVLVDWNVPGMQGTELRYDDGVAVGQLGFGSNPAATMGSVHRVGATVNAVTWLLTGGTPEAPSPNPQAKIVIFGLTAQGTPDQSNILHESELLTNVDAEWNTYILETPVSAPNGFYVGVVTPNSFTSLGYDDGVDEPYVFEANTQYGCSNYTDSAAPWLELSTTSLDEGQTYLTHSFLVRAYADVNQALAYNIATPVANNTNDVVATRLPQPINTRPTRAFVGYNVYRDGTLLNDTLLTETEYSDTGLTTGTTYEYVVKAVYEETVIAADAVSITLAEATASVTGVIKSAVPNSTVVIANAAVHIESPVYSADTTSDAQGVYTFADLLPGTYTVTAMADGYATGSETVTITDAAVTADVALSLLLTPPANLVAVVSNHSTITLNWEAPAGPVASYNIYKSVDGGNFELTDNVNALTYTEQDLLDGAYTYRVTSIWEADLESIPSNEASASVMHAPAAMLEVGDITGTTATFNWGAPGSGGIVNFSDDFEAYEDFTLDLAPWTTIDVDQTITYGFQNYTFPHSGEAMAAIIMNPSQVVANPGTDPFTADPHSGSKFVAMFNPMAPAQGQAVPPANDWLITPRLSVMAGNQLRFWAKTFYGYSGGTEMFNVLVSTAGTEPTDFTVISGDSPVSAPQEAWTEFTYDLSAYANQAVHIAIQCVSHDQFFLMIDDFSVGATAPAFAFNANPATTVSAAAVKSYTANTVAPATTFATRTTRTVTGYKVFLGDAEQGTTAEDVTTYTFTGLDQQTVYTAGVKVMYSDGQESEMMTVDFTTTPGNDGVNPAVTELTGNYPNPFNPTTNVKFNLAEKGHVNITIYNILGQKVKTICNEVVEPGKVVKVWNGKDSNGKNVASGIYFYKMKTARYTSTKKMILMK